MRDNIQGEETAKFTNALGESIVLAITEDPAKTAECLLKILDGNSEAADLLAAEVHKNVVCTDAMVENLPDLVRFYITNVCVYLFFFFNLLRGNGGLP